MGQDGFGFMPGRNKARRVEFFKKEFSVGTGRVTGSLSSNSETDIFLGSTDETEPQHTLFLGRNIGKIFG